MQGKWLAGSSPRQRSSRQALLRKHRAAPRHGHHVCLARDSWGVRRGFRNAPGMVCRGTWHNLELSAGADLRTDDRRAGANLGNTISPRGRNASFLAWFPNFLQGPGFQSTRNLLGAHCRGLFVAPASAMSSTQRFTAAICCLNLRLDAMRMQVERCLTVNWPRFPRSASLGVPPIRCISGGTAGTVVFRRRHFRFLLRSRAERRWWPRWTLGSDETTLCGITRLGRRWVTPRINRGQEG